ncbi:MAG: glycosyltransferase family 2 protein [Moraxella sp.]|uniref:glycosyltransferase family 2 protein n=1 Tax=Moraxella sp. TaxID=479 RepID=UPI0026DA76AB|nr:glycosyltransferase family 2 protein [Moraxella sp.]MDO4449461.1 glycosyltransferase family 2 protein [Moraxella sp.]
MKLSILIVNYNTEKFICDLLLSLENQTFHKSDYEIIIVNNIQNSKLDEMIKNHCFEDKFNLRIINSDDNIGFGRAMNLGFRCAKGEHVLLMNPDIKMRQDDYLQNLLNFAHKNNNYGIISTRVLDDNNNDTSTYYSYEFGQTLGFDGQICWFQGSLLLIRHEIFKQLDGFDDDFFMYCEDVDLCLRVKKLGLDLLKNDDLEVYHFGGASEPNHNYDYYLRYYKSRFLFAKKHYQDDIFADLIDKFYQKTRSRIVFYQILSLMFKKYQRHYLKNKVTYDICHKIKQQGTNWLVYSPN